jgi:TetR/AcrR family transcriptional regulator, transcriptional repressor for nem operon
MKKPIQAPISTQQKIIWNCIQLMQEKGFDAVGMREIAIKTKIEAASLYYHFASKDDLATAGMEAYRLKQASELERLDSETSLRAKLFGYVALYTRMLLDERICFCVLLLSKRDGLSPKTLNEVRKFIDQNISWLAETLGNSKGRGDFQKAEIIFKALEGMMLLATADKNPAGAFKRQSTSLLNALVGEKDGLANSRSSDGP